MMLKSPVAGIWVAPAAGPIERLLLTVVLLGIVVIYAALGRDVFSNSLVLGRNDDLVSAILPFLRIAVCATGLLILLATTDLRWMIDRIPWLLLPYIAVALASAAWSPDPKTTLRNMAGFVSMWVALPLVVHRLGLARTIRILLHVIAVVLILSALLALLVPGIGRHTGLEVVQQNHIGRWRGIFPHKNALGGWAALGSVFLFTHVRAKGAAIPYWWGARCAAVLCLVMAQSATAIVLAAVLLATWAGLRISRGLPGILALSINLVIAACLAVLVVAFNELLFGVLGRNAGLTGRPIIWAIAEHFFWLRPLLGSGFGTLGGPDFLEYVLEISGQAIPGPESGYLVLLLETGVVGTACFLLAVLAAGWAGLRWHARVSGGDRDALEFALMVLVGALVTGVAESRAFIYFGADTIITYSMFLSLLALPKPPGAVVKTLMPPPVSFSNARRFQLENEVPE